MNRKNILHAGLLALLSSIIISSCGSSGKQSITISGAFALYPLVNVWVQEFGKVHPEIKFNVSGGGAGKGMTDVLNGASDIGMFSREVANAEANKGAWKIAVAKDAVVPTISARNPLLNQLQKEGATRAELSDYFLRDAAKKHWKNADEAINVYTRSDAAGAADVWAEYLGGSGQEAIKGIAVYGDPGLADAVKKDPRGIGFNNVNYVYDLKTGHKYPGMEVLPIDLNENGKIDSEENFYETLDEINAAIVDGRYPSPPARPLYLITKGKPVKPEVILFLNWVLTKGQDFIPENGYIELPKEVIEAQKKKL